MTKNETIKGVEELVKKYKDAKDSKQLKAYSEEDTKKDFILPLFELLGWDITNRKEVSSEEHIKSAGRVDLGFYINGRPKFLLEAKQLSADLHREEYAHQAIRYSWNKGITWAVLTDFESIKVFNAEAVSKYLGDKLVFEIPYDEYVSRFEKLWQLSREAFENDSLDKYAEEIGKKLQKIPVSELLYKDLNECRNLLLNALRQWNGDKNISNELLEEGVQKLIDRLVFIRVLEDRGIEPSTLRPLVREWEASEKKNEVPLYKYMISKFRELNDIYNSNIFTPHPFEEWEEYSDDTRKVIEILYGKKGYYEYDFKAMPVDVLGNVYENYLGRILSQSKKGIEITKDSKKRKEQGIYYTPSFIVDYIVENSLKPVLDKCNTIADLRKIKVLDPACGSGSFLIKALEVINEKYKEFGARGDEFTKLQILTENIYGVDLDEQAVEIARLNLLIGALDTRMKLPTLTNIKNGNSLISGTDEELEKYFGKNFRDKRPFNWKEEFPEVFKQGGFDVIIGNPPWVSLKGKFKGGDFSAKEIEFLTNRYKSNTYAPNLYEMFIYRSMELLKEKGFLGFIVPDRLSSNQQFVDLRKKILEDFTLKSAIFGVDFPGIIADTMIIIISRNKSNPEDKIYLGNFKKGKFGLLPTSLFLPQDDNSFYYIDEKIFNIFSKILASSRVKRLSQIADSTSGCGAKTSEIHFDKKNDREIQIVKGENIGRYRANGHFWFEFKNENLTGRTRDKNKLGEKNKLLVRKTGADLIATFDDSGVYPEQSLYFIYSVDVKTLYYLLAVINSKLMNTYYKNFSVTNRDSTPQLKNIHLDKFPIVDPQSVSINDLVMLVKKILELNKKIRNEPEKSNKWNLIKAEIEKIDKKIDEEVYKLYGLNGGEVKIVEEFIN